MGRSLKSIYFLFPRTGESIPNHNRVFKVCERRRIKKKKLPIPMGSLPIPMGRPWGGHGEAMGRSLKNALIDIGRARNSQVKLLVLISRPHSSARTNGIELRKIFFLPMGSLPIPMGRPWGGHGEVTQIDLLSLPTHWGVYPHS